MTPLSAIPVPALHWPARKRLARIPPSRSLDRWRFLAFVACFTLHAAGRHGAMSASSQTAQMSPARPPPTATVPFLRGGGGSYRWQAALNQTTGLVGAKETTVVPAGSALHQQFCCRTGGASAAEGDGGDDDSDLLGWTEQWARRYPLWLCTGPVTFGLLRAVVVAPNKEAGRDSAGRRTVDIRTRLGNLTLLRFGPTSSHRITYREVIEDNGGTNASVRQVQTTHCTVILPVTGGALALLPPGKAGRAPSTAAKDRGALVFSLKKRRRLPSSASDRSGERQGDDPSAPAPGRKVDGGGGSSSVDANTSQRDPSSRDRRGRDSDGNDDDAASSCQLLLSTTVVGYRPWLAGRRLPVPRWRQALYLGSQSVLHNWIMWRSHRYAWASKVTVSTKDK